MNSKIYTTNPYFTKMATTGNGKFLIGSKKGEIRLFDKLGKKAKTLLPGLGDEIIGIDVTYSGHWIIATTPYYLLVIPTLFSETKNGFDYQMGKEKPHPWWLTLATHDKAKFGLSNQKFSKATFNNGQTNWDTQIVTSIGKYVVTWKLKDIKKGNLALYEIK